MNRGIWRYGSSVRRIFQLWVTFFQVYNCWLRVQVRDDIVWYQQLLQALVIEKVCCFQQVESVKNFQLTNLPCVHISDILFKCLSFNPLWNNESLLVWSSHLILIFIDHLVFFECFLEVFRWSCHNYFMASEFLSAQLQNHVPRVLNWGKHLLEGIICWKKASNKKLL